MTELHIPQDGRGSYGKQVRANNKKKIIAWSKQNPLGTHKECAKELNLSKVTVYAVVKEIRAEQANNKKRIIAWSKKNPLGTHVECARILNLSKLLVSGTFKKIRSKKKNEKN